MTVYLDNNIIVSIENGECSIDQIISLFPNQKIKFYYSSAHIYEIETFKGSASISKSELLSQRLDSIRNIFNNNYLYLNLSGNLITHIIEDPETVFNTITEVPFGIEAIKGFTNLFTKEQKREYREQLGIEIRKLNNYSSTEIISHLNKNLANLGSMSFLEMIEYGIQIHPDGKTFGLHNRIAGVFELLDMLGYWKDKETETSNYARLWDSSHTFFATYCDYFISDDKRTRHKANVVYNLYNKRTKIISSQGI